jgi:hypothetical protein
MGSEMPFIVIPGKNRIVNICTTNLICLIPFVFAICINTISKCCVGMRNEKKMERKAVNYRKETCRRVLILSSMK